MRAPRYHPRILGADLPLAEALQERFRSGFYPNRLAAWRTQLISQKSEKLARIQIEPILKALTLGQRRFGYGEQ